MVASTGPRRRCGSQLSGQSVGRRVGSSETRKPGSPYFEPSPGDPFDAVALVTACVESGAQGILLDDRVLPPEFFDLSTGLAGEILHKLTMYRIRLAVVVPNVSLHSPSFRAFLREANSGSQIRFHSTREQAMVWLESR